MKRRELMLLLSGTAMVGPLAAGAQQKAVIGTLSANLPLAENSPPRVGFRQGLREAGYIEGQNLAIESRWAAGDYDRLPAMAADLVSRKVDVIVSTGVIPTQVAKSTTSTIPIVFALVSDPVGYGFVASLARPGGNITGFSNVVSQLTPKRLELLSELVPPKAKVIALLVNPRSPTTAPLISDMQEAARATGIRLDVLNASTESEIDAAFAALVGQHVGGLIIAGDPFITTRRNQVVALAVRHAIPVMYADRNWTEAGGLISYGINNSAVLSHVGSYVGKILKGANPADLPVQQPTKFELVINLKTAHALGLTVPQSLLARADEVIE